MKIRSITCFTSITPQGNIQEQAAVTQAAELGKQLFSQAGYEVQTTRLATQPFPGYFPHEPVAAGVFAQQMELKVEEAGFAYLSIGPASSDIPWAYPLIPIILANTTKVFCTGIIAEKHEGISLPAIRECGQIIARITPLTPDGFTNLRFAALANVAPHGPFFPAAYHDGGKPGFSLAIECADVVLETIQNSADITSACNNIKRKLEEHAAKLEKLCAEITSKTELQFFGFDFSPAPFPEDNCSLGGAIEAFGVQIGMHGGVAAAAILAAALDNGNWKKAGFNGMMLPVLEDSILAKRTENNTFGIKDLLLYSTVCGTGLDTVPLPGDSTPEQLSAILLDVAALSMRLNKPLTARLMPVPGKKAGDLTGFDFAFFMNGRVMELPALPLTGLLAGDETITITPRRTIG